MELLKFVASIMSLEAPIMLALVRYETRSADVTLIRSALGC